MRKFLNVLVIVLGVGLASLGEIQFLGAASISNAQKANLFAVLACSAHHLMCLTAPREANPTDRWRAIRDSCRQQAKSHLQESLKSEMQGPEKAKYKDQLMALLVMTGFSVSRHGIVAITS